MHDENDDPRPHLQCDEGQPPTPLDVLWMSHGPAVGLLTLACSGHAAGWLASRVVWDAQN